MARLKELLKLAEQQIGYQEKHQLRCWMIHMGMPDIITIQNMQEM